uniref:uncharacterized protein LOC100179472 isoform X2 n=1 Tax=Ciona intestinalis TaxID=7719 RepID=UPI000EF4D971|nr:uncharacterized protein LOC100179472 isoform X2 [Ciona intestinalis]XP_026693168.1 uncharacterized protein LOC100179472 isoform X2 [Ciona intestinalis]|eukprot:XP_002130867.2 uncharacterized protein LOC100179472 isoform X2 [Ciona intestinalis]
MLNFCFSFVLSISTCLAIDTVVMIPTSCGVTEPRGPGKIIQAQPGVAMGVSEYTPLFPACSYTMVAATANHRIRFNFGTGMGEVNFIDHPNGCGAANVQLLDSDGLTQILPLTCGVLDRTEYLSTGDRMTIEAMSTGGNGTIFNFTAQYTSFTDAVNCSDDPSVFPCANGRCVDPAGRCDVTLINNCGDFSDNSRGPPGNCSTPTTTVVMTTAPGMTLTPPGAPESDSPSLLWIAWVALGLVGAYLFYWLLWRPGYLTWRCGAWRHIPFCRKHGLCQKPTGSSPSGGTFTCCSESKVASDASQIPKDAPVTSQPGPVTSQSGQTNGVFSESLPNTDA